MIIHVFVVEVQDVHHHRIGVFGGTVGIDVHRATVVVQRLLPVSLVTPGISAEVLGLVPVLGRGLKEEVQFFDGQFRFSPADEFFYGIQFLHIQSLLDVQR